MQKQQPVVRSPDVVKQPVMVYPHNPDKREADQKSRIHRPLPGKCLSQMPYRSGWNFQVQDQQSDSYGENTIRERFDTGGFVLHLWKSWSTKFWILAPSAAPAADALPGH